MIMTPMVLVVKAQLFCHASPLEPPSVSNSMPNILLKFCPRQWDVAPCKTYIKAAAHTKAVKQQQCLNNHFCPRQWGVAPCNAYIKAAITGLTQTCIDFLGLLCGSTAQDSGMLHPVSTSKLQNRHDDPATCMFRPKYCRCTLEAL